MTEQSVPKTEEAPKGSPREIWHPPLTAEKRAERVRLAKAFLAAFGDDEVTTHTTCLERLDS